MFALSLCSLGNLSKTCTEAGWTPFSIDSYVLDCGYNPNNTMDENKSVWRILSDHMCLRPDFMFDVKLSFFLQGEFFGAIKVGYTIGHSVSLISLTMAIIVLCLFR